jgi:hypothetical protein
VELIGDLEQDWCEEVGEDQGEAAGRGGLDAPGIKSQLGVQMVGDRVASCELDGGLVDVDGDCLRRAEPQRSESQHSCSSAYVEDVRQGPFPFGKELVEESSAA